MSKYHEEKQEQLQKKSINMRNTTANVYGGQSNYN